MKRTTRSTAVLACLALLCLLALPVAASAAATSGSWTGWITDEACGAKGHSADHKNCAVKCADKGSKLVLYNNADQKIYKLDKQDLAKQHIGDQVTVTGKVDGDKIAVDSIAAMAPAPPAKGK
jgi:hypothetical protein